MQEVLSFFLSSIGGIEIAATAGDGLSTLELVKAHRPALVVIDGDLPDADMPDLVGQIKTGPSQPKIIVLANGTWQEQQLLMHGTDAVLHRGVALTKILGVIRQLSSSKSQIAV
jgi:DNA-binding NarL/FixJ family response regulator